MLEKSQALKLLQRFMISLQKIRSIDTENGLTPEVAAILYPKVHGSQGEATLRVLAKVLERDNGRLTGMEFYNFMVLLNHEQLLAVKAHMIITASHGEPEPPEPSLDLITNPNLDGGFTP